MFLFFLRLRSTIPNVIGPIRPINIKIIITNFPKPERDAVIPVLNPTVPSADADSKNIVSKLKFSIERSKNTPRNRIKNRM